jgi:hypothetical protein
MSWWESLREGRRARPQTVEPVGHGEVPAVSGPLGTWLRAAFAADEPVEQHESEALARLRDEPERSLAEIAGAYDGAPQHDYALRWALVYAAGQLGSAAAVDFLARILDAEISPERSSDIHLFSTVAQETSLRCQAVRGLAGLAARGSDRARLSLLEQLSNRSYTVRVIASQVLRELPGQYVADDEIRRRLPADEADTVLAIRKVSVEELEPVMTGAVSVTAPRPPGGESGTELNLRDARPPAATGRGANRG